MKFKHILYSTIILGLLTTCYKDPAPSRLNFNPQELNFNEDSTTLSFRIYNKGEQDLIWRLVKSVDWIDSFQTTTGLLHCNDIATITVNIDRSKLASGQNESQLKINESGITVKAFHNFQPSDIQLSNKRLRDLQPVNTPVGVLRTIDRDPTDKHTYTFVAGSGDGDNNSFRIQNDKLMSNAVFNISVRTTYNIRVRSTDSNGKTVDKPFTIVIFDSNLAPTDIILDNNTIVEKRPVNTNIGTFTTNDNAGDTHIYTLVSGVADNLNFELKGAVLSSKTIFDFKTKSTYNISVRSTDSRGKFFEKTFTILIKDSNNPPTGLTLSPDTILENRPVNTLIGRLSSTDDAGDTHTYKLVSGAGDTGNSNFSITGNGLFSKLSFNYESQTSYTIRVETTDAGGKTYQRILPVLIKNANEGITDLVLSRNTIQENEPINTIIGVFTSQDVDLGDTHTYTLVTGFGDNSNFRIDGRILRSGAIYDFETKNRHSIRVRSQDAGGESYEKTFAINITDIREAATDITLSADVIAENRPPNTLIGNFTSTDADAGDTHTYSLVSGFGDANNSNFQIVGNSLRSRVSFNYENKTAHSIRVQSRDRGNQTFEKIFIIFINNVNDAPTDLRLSNNTLAENVALNTVVGGLTTVDEDVGDTHTYSLVAGAGDADNSSFRIVGSNLQTNTALDYETKNSYTIRVRTTDARGLFFEKSFNITITNVRVWVGRNASWSRRSGHTALVYDNKLWIMGGTSTFSFGTPKNDVWYTSDGITWTEATASAAWAARSNHSSVVFDNKMWVIGGRTGTTTPWTTSQNDVYHSTDGITWTRATNNAAWAARMGHSSVVFNNRIWVVGGVATGRTPTRFQDAWSSTDGITWTRATPNAFSAGRYYHTSLAYNNKIWLLGGFDTDQRNDVRNSSNGNTWTQVTAGANWSRRQEPRATVYDGKMWISAGNGSTSYLNDIWYSTDGITWTEETAPNRMQGRTSHVMVTFRNRIWILGGEVPLGGLSSITRNDVWELDP